MRKNCCLKRVQSKQLAEKIQPDLDVYLRDDNELLELTKTNDNVILRPSLKQKRSKRIEELN